MNARAAVPLQVKERKVQSSMTASLLNMLAKCTSRHHVFLLPNQIEVEVVYESFHRKKYKTITQDAAEAM